ncbi:hypothetical protein PV779_30540 [Streptomyces sp. ID01-9D]|nr:hypothetical protein [Streptomyces sp. ID01-9D]
MAVRRSAATVAGSGVGIGHFNPRSPTRLRRSPVQWSWTGQLDSATEQQS